MYRIFATREKAEVKKEKEEKQCHKTYPARRYWVVERTNSWHNRFRKLFT